MNKNLVALFFVSIIFFSCKVSHKNTSASDISTAQVVEVASADQQDGSSFATAIVIQQKSTGPGIKEEYIWVREHYPNSRVVKQELHHVGRKSYDVLTVEKDNGDLEVVHFDITRFFGKF
jgi:hypothetical protein